MGAFFKQFQLWKQTTSVVRRVHLGTTCCCHHYILSWWWWSRRCLSLSVCVQLLYRVVSDAMQFSCCVRLTSWLSRILCIFCFVSQFPSALCTPPLPAPPPNNPLWWWYSRGVVEEELPWKMFLLRMHFSFPRKGSKCSSSDHAAGLKGLSQWILCVISCTIFCKTK